MKHGARVPRRNRRWLKFYFSIITMKALLQRLTSLFSLTEAYKEVEVPQEPQEEITYEKNILNTYSISGYQVSFLEIIKKQWNFQIEWYATEIIKGEKTVLVGEYNDKDVAEFYHYRALREVLDISKIKQEIAKIK